MSGGNLQRLRQCLVELHLPTFREHHGSQAALATKESWSYPQYLLALSELEVSERRERRIQRLRRVLEASLGQESDVTGPDTASAECESSIIC